MSNIKEDKALLSQELLEHLTAARGDEDLKEAANAQSVLLKRRLREAGIFRQIIEPQPVGDKQLTRMPGHEGLVLVREMEADSPGAAIVPFGAPVDKDSFHPNSYISVFQRIQTKEYYKDINELRVLGYDLPKWFQDNSIKDIQKAEDFDAFAVVDEIVGPVGGVGKAGYQQNHRIVGDITRRTYPNLLNFLERNELPNGVFVMNSVTSKRFITNFDLKTYGDAMTRDTFQKGMGALRGEILGIPHIFTMKRGLIPDGVVYIFTEQDFLGNFDILSDVKLYMSKKKDIITFSAEEIIALTFGNVAGVHRVEFV